MGQKDLNEKVLEDFNEVFADIYNTLYFQKEFVHEEKLLKGPTESVYKAANKELREQRRDVCKYYEDTYVFAMWSLGIENQSTQDKTIPIRIMGYDYIAYKAKVDNHERILPVITIVLNFSMKRWDTACSLHDLMDIPEDMKRYVQDYQVKVYDIAFLSDETINSFQSDFKWIAKLFKAKRTQNIKELALIQEEIKHVEAFMDMLAVFTDDETYRQIAEELQMRNQKGESVKVCNIVTTFMDMGREEGREEGRAATAKKLVEAGVEKSIIIRCTGYSEAELEALVTA